jgi:hypothetical protein
MDDRKADYERAIFKLFLKASSLRVARSSIEPRQPPEPDLCCTIGNRRVAFELVEAIDPRFAGGASESNRQIAVMQAFFDQQSLATRRALRASLGNAWIWVLFADGNRREREKSIPGLFEFLATLTVDALGDYEIGAEYDCPCVPSVTIMRSDDIRRPRFDVTYVRSVGDPLLTRVKEKWQKSYQTPYETQLLAFYNMQTSRLAQLSLKEVEEFVRDNWSTSPFKRVWVYDVGKAKILLDLAWSTKQ